MNIIPILAVIGALAVSFLIYVAMKSGDFHIQRSLAIKAPPEAIFPLINDLHQFNRWNPFALSDPNGKIDCSGPVHGGGATYDWNGKKSGAAFG